MGLLKRLFRGRRPKMVGVVMVTRAGRWRWQLRLTSNNHTVCTSTRAWASHEEARDNGHLMFPSGVRWLEESDIDDA